MCQLFIDADSLLWTSKTKSLRIDGVAISIRLENFFWNILDEVAFRDDKTVKQMITLLYLESLDVNHDIGNFTSFLRVCCSRYLSLIADGILSRENKLSLNSLDASSMISNEGQLTQSRKIKFVEPDDSLNL